MSHASIARNLRRELSPDWNTVGPFQWGKVASVSGGTVDLYLDGATGLTTGIPCLASYSPQVGDVTMVARMQGAAQAARVAIGTLKPKPIFSGYASTSQTLAASTGTIILINTAVIDTASGFDSGTSVYTVPWAGVYRANGQLMNGASATGGQAYINQNATTFYGAGPNISEAYQGYTVTKLLECAAGDTLVLGFLNRGGASQTYIPAVGASCYFDIELL